MSSENGINLLSAKAGVHAHDQNVVEHGEHVIEQVDTRCRIEDHARLHAVVANVLDGAMQMDAGFVVHADPVSPRFGEGGDELICILDHEVAIERQLCDLAQRLHDRWPKRDVGDEVAVHHVDVNDSTAAALGGSDIFRQPGEVCRQY